MFSLDGHSGHELPRCCPGNTISSWTFFDPSGHGILYFGSATVVEYFQTICSSIGLRLRVGSASILDLGQTKRKVSTRRWMELSKGYNLIYLRVLDLSPLTREKAHFSRKMVENLASCCSTGRISFASSLRLYILACEVRIK